MSEFSRQPPPRRKTPTRKPAFDHEPTAVHSRRDQARLAAVGLHPRLVARAESEPITALRPLAKRWPAFAAGTPPTTSAEIPQRAHTPSDFLDMPTPPRPRRAVRPAAKQVRVARSQPRAQPQPRPQPQPQPPRLARPIPRVAQPAPRPPQPAPRPARPSPPPPRLSPPVPIRESSPRMASVPGAPAPVPERARSVIRHRQAVPSEGVPLSEIARLRPLPRPPSSPTLHTLESVPGDRVAATDAAAPSAAAEARSSRRSGWLLATVAGLCCVIAWAVGPLALAVAVADQRAIAAALTAALLAPMLAPMLMASILRARGYRGWMSVAATVLLALVGIAACWATRLAAPALLDLGTQQIVADPAAALAVVEAGVMRGLDTLTAPHLLAVWGSEACLVIAMLIVSGRRLRAAAA